MANVIFSDVLRAARRNQCLTAPYTHDAIGRTAETQHNGTSLLCCFLDWKYKSIVTVVSQIDSIVHRGMTQLMKPWQGW
jgi:hypothetical protein